jgi:cephalosporin-C deacetylase-like acetyl esterase
MPLSAQPELDILPTQGRNELFHQFLMDEGHQLWEQRRADVQAALASPQALADRQTYLRQTYRELLGELPAPTPLSPVVVDTIQANGYRIEKLHFQSRPNHHVTGNFYLPDGGTGPYPAVLVLCGHYPVAKSIELYQDLCISLALNGFAALIVDPISQGERNQVQSPTTGALAFRGQSGTSAHSRLDVGAVLTGSSVVAHSLWDNHRAVDYLYARLDVVDTSRVGVTGSSGGGSQATYLAAYDPRLKVAAINSFLMNEETLFQTIGPQTASQNLSYEGAYGIDHPDYLTMFAPKPYLILGATRDFFDIGATRDTYQEALDVYTVLGEADQVAFFEEDNLHGYTTARREKAVQWFRTWFYNDTSAVVEPATVNQSYADLQVTDTGQVVYAFQNERTVTDINVAREQAYAAQRAAFWSQQTLDSCLNKVQALIRLAPVDSLSVQEVGSIDRGDYTITKLSITTGSDVPVTGLLFVPEGLTGPAPAVLYVDGRGKQEDAGAGGVIERLMVDSGKVVLSIDVRGFGETLDNPSKNESKHGNREHRNAVISLYLGKTLIGQRVADVQKALDVMAQRSEIDPNQITLIGVDRAGPVALHVAALDLRVQEVMIRASFDSWIDIVASPTELNNMTHEIPGALQYYDLTNLATAIAPRPVSFFEDPYAVPTGIKGLGKASGAWLGQSYPNPTSGQVTWTYGLAQPGPVRLVLLNPLGQEIKTLLAERQDSGTHQVQHDLRNLPGGTYLYQLWLDDALVGSRMMWVNP